MAEDSFTFSLSDKLKAAFIKAAEAQCVTPPQLMRGLMEKEVAGRRKAVREHEAWFRGEVEQALREADDPSIQRIPHDSAQSLLSHKRPFLDRGSRSSTLDPS